MSEDNIDNELARLYQQRKANVEAPQIDLASRQVKPQPASKIARVLMLSCFGGVASFGVFALMTHFIKPTKTTHQVSITPHHDVVTVEIEHTDLDENTIAVPSLPPKPAKPLPPEIEARPINLPESNDQPVGPNVELNVQRHYVVNVPQLKEPTNYNVQPTIKVMPSYRIVDPNKFSPGAVKLSYTIDGQGHVNDIKIVESTVSRELRVSARKALKKWRYAKSAASPNVHHVIFEFSAVAG